MIHMMMYTIPPEKTVSSERRTYTILTNVGSRSKYSARPAHTPPSIRSFDLNNLLLAILLIFLSIIKMRLFRINF